MQRPITRGAAADAGLIFHIFAQDSVSTTGAGKASIAFSSWACRYIRNGEAISGAITPQDITTIGTYAAPTANTNVRIKAVDNTNMIGVYEVQIHLDWVNVTNTCQSLTIYLTATGVAVLPLQIPLDALVRQIVPGAAGGLFIAGTNAPVIITGSGPALTLTSTAANGNGLLASGNGSGAGIRGVGGATGHGINGQGGATSGHGVAGVAVADGAGLYGISTGGYAGIHGNAGSATLPGIGGYGNGSGAGIAGTGGATGVGIAGTGGATSGAGAAFLAAAGNSDGLIATKQGAGKDINGRLTVVTLADTVTTYTGNTPQTGDSFARIGAAGAGLTAIDLPNQTMDITGNLSGSVGSVTGAVGSVTGHTPQTGDNFARLGAPAGASVSADIAAIEAQTDDIGAAGAGLTAIPDLAGVTTLLARLSAARAGYLDNLSAGAVALEASLQGLITTVGAAGAGLTATATAVWAVAVRVLSAATNITSTGGTTVPQTGDSFARIGAAGAGLTAIDLPNQTMDITGNLSGSVGSVTGAVGSVTSFGTLVADVATAVWGAATRTLSAAGVQAIWDALTSALTTVGSIGKRLADNIDATVSSRLATVGYTAPPSVGAIADQVWDETLADHLGAGSTGNALNAAGAAGDPWSTAIPGAYGAGTAGKIVGDNVNATISSRASQVSVDDLPTNAELATALGTADDAVLAAIAALNNLSQVNIRTAVGLASANLDTQLDALPTNAELATALAAADDAVLAALAALNNLSAAQVRTELSVELARIDQAVSAAKTLTVGERTAIADAHLGRDLSLVAGAAARSPLNAHRFGRNHWEIVGDTLTVFKEDDATIAWTAVLTKTSGNPVSASDPA